MPQTLLPIVPDGATSINAEFSVVVRDGMWAYHVGALPVFTHAAGDRAGFRMFTSQAVVQGLCRQVDIVRAFGVSSSSVKRGVTRFLEGGAKAFFAARKGRGPAVLTDEVKARAQALLDEKRTRAQVAKALGIGKECLRKAIESGRLHEIRRCAQTLAAVPALADARGTDKSERSIEDAGAAMGMGCTRPLERVLAAMGRLAHPTTRFEHCRDVPLGGVLTALPALCANGLLRHLDSCFAELSGYYTRLHIVLVLAFMALGRIRHVEELRYQAPGEWGKLLGLDRIPEVRTLRGKIKALCRDQSAEQWQALLASDWMQADPQAAGVLYVDGHVRVYHGKQTKLPRRYVARDRLCLRGVTDYYVNDIAGRPFFAVERQVDAGMLEALRSDIVPRLLQDVPRQPTDDELEHDPLLARFSLVFDREGYSPAFFKSMWREHRIACMTYHKYPREDWRGEEFHPCRVAMPNGEDITMHLAERGSLIGSGKDKLWLREIRKLTGTGHQTSIITTAYQADAAHTSARMFSRWAQENFFKYMSQHYAIDALSEYGSEDFPEPQRVVNPAWRALDAKLRSLRTKLNRARALFAAHEMHPETEPRKMEQALRHGAELRQNIECLEREAGQIKAQRKQTNHHVTMDQLPEDQQFQRLIPDCKQFTNTIKLIAYRAETAMTILLREHLGRHADARPLIRDLLSTEADLIPDEENGTLTVRIHPMTNPRATRAIADMLPQLNETHTPYPGTGLRLNYEVGMPQANESEMGQSILP